MQDIKRDAARDIEIALRSVADQMYESLVNYLQRCVEQDGMSVPDAIAHTRRVATDIAHAEGALRVLQQGSNSISTIVDRVASAAALAFVRRLNDARGESIESAVEYLRFWQDTTLRSI